MARPAPDGLPSSDEKGRPAVRRAENEPESTTATPASDLYGLRIGQLWTYLTDQPLSFWLICTYLFLEYVRPQQIYPSLEGLPLPQVTLALTAVALVLEGKLVRRFNVADAGLVLFGGVILASSTLAWEPAYSFGNLKTVANWLIVYYMISILVDTEKRFLVFMFSFLLYSLKMSQHATRSWASAGFGFRDWGVTGAPGWFSNSGEFAIQMVIFIPLSVYFILALRRYWRPWKVWLMWLLPATGVIGILASSSRGGQIGLAAIAIAMAAKSRRKIRALGAIALVAVAGYVMLPEAQKERFTQIGEDETSQLRLTYWEHGIEITNDRPVFGIGYDNWLPYYRRYYNPFGQQPHNIYIEAGAELGYVGLLSFFLLIGATLYLNHRTRSIVRRCKGDPSFLYYMAHGLDVALVGFLITGTFVTVLYYPFFWINLAMTAALYTAARRRLAATSVSFAHEAPPARVPSGR